MNERWLGWLVVPALTVACGGNNSTSVDARAVDASPDAHVTVVNETGTAVDQITGAPIASAQVCAYGLADPPCATTAADGTYSMAVPLPDTKTQIALVTTADGYLGRENDLAEDPASGELFWETTHGLYASADASTLFATDAGFTYPSSSTGFIEIMVFPSSVTGNAPSVTATISPTASTPVYGGSDGSATPDPALTATPGTADVGFVYFGDIAPGTYQITVQSANGMCTSLYGSGTVNGEWPPTGSASVSAGAYANVLNIGIVVDCP
ncbi:MAG TPA: hypothetical protein VGG74_26315 [Kofleriaceae bacterium]|jgi:hypothetical protein